MDTLTDRIQTTAIHGLLKIPKRVIRDDRGAVLHMLRNDSDYFDGKFGEIYFSTIKPGVVKGWKKHLEMKQRFVVPVGEVEFIFYDDRAESPSIGCCHREIISESNYQLLLVPELLWYAFKGSNARESLIVNCASIPHKANETATLDYHSSGFPLNFTT